MEERYQAYLGSKAAGEVTGGATEAADESDG
jgi:hypothetical protein